MGRDIVGRITAWACVAVMLAAFALLLDENSDLASVNAQAQPTAIPGANIQLPPPVPGLDYTPLQPGQATIPDAATSTGTPAPAAPAAPGTTTAPSAGGSVTATLSGSDIAVSSVGGSYERDVPKNRRDRDRRR